MEAIIYLDEKDKPPGPTYRQIVFNWVMCEPDFATRKDGWWGTSDEVASVDALLTALGLPRNIPERTTP